MMLSKKGLVVAWLLLLIPISALAQGPQPEYVPGEVLVKTKSMLTGVQLTGLIASVKRAQRLTRQVSKLELAKEVDVNDAISQLRQNPLVEYAQPNYIKRIQQVIPDDVQFKYQWGIQNTGQVVNQTVGTPGADIKATGAWEITRGDPGVVIAVIDTGVDLTHPDLQGNLWVNAAETVDGVDDDGDSYIDDTGGWDFVQDDNMPLDLNGHGTHVAGIIAAQGNNQLYTSGVMWRAAIMPLRVFDANGLGKTEYIIKAIDYAVNHGANIINASFGAQGSANPQSGGFDQAEYNALQNAGIPVITAACNNGQNNDQVILPCVPASYNLPNIIAVAATDQKDRLASFSNYGSESVDVAAPGVNIASIDPEFSERWQRSLTSLSGMPVTTDADLSDGTGCRLWINPDQITSTFSFPIDEVRVRASTDGGSSWQLVSVGKISEGLRFDLSGFKGFAGLMIDLTPYAGGQPPNEDVGFGMVVLDCYSGSHSPTSVTLLGGTSLSSAYVTGVAGLIYAKFGPLDPNQVYNQIVNTVDQTTELAGKIKSGGRVNALRALDGSGGGGNSGSGGGSSGGGGMSAFLLFVVLLRLWFHPGSLARCRAGD